MKKYLSRIINAVLILVLAVVLYQRLPGLYYNYKSQNQRAPYFTVDLLSGGTFDLHNSAEKKIIVFWATWCGPCDVELGRLNKLIQTNEIKRQNILAISIGESKETVADAVVQRAYLFDVALDTDSNVARLFKVAGTPTVIFIDENAMIRWMTTGLSPTLGFRAKSFLN